MKKSLLFLAFFTTILSTAHAQNELKLGVYAGTALNDYFGDTNILLGADLAYLFPLNEVISIGPGTGLGLVLINGADNYGVVPFTASGRIRLNERFFAGADVGYSLLFIDEVDGGFYYRPKLGYDFESFSVLASYTGITQNGGGISFATLGIEFKL